MQIQKAVKFADQRVLLDGGAFHDCEFVRCTLVYEGGAPPQLIGCLFHDVRWSLGGAAAATIGFLRGLYHGAGEGGQRVIEATFENIRRSP